MYDQLLLAAEPHALAITHLMLLEMLQLEPHSIQLPLQLKP